MERFHSVIQTVRRHVLFVVGVAALGAMVAPASAAQAPAKATPKAKSGLNIMLMKPTAAKTGDNQFEVMVQGADGKPVSNADVMVLLVMPAVPAKKMPEMRNEVMLK